MIIIEHSHAEGTLITGTAKGDGTADILRRHGFRWMPSIHRWGIRGSRDHTAKRYQINATADALRAAGYDVQVNIDDTPRDYDTVQQSRELRAEDRRDALDAKAVRSAERADAAYRGARALAETIPLGQPILVGHHSERRHRRDLDRIDRGYATFADQSRRADDYARRAQATETEAAYRMRPDVVARRIEATEADLRRIQRALDGYTRNFYDGHGELYYVEEHEPATGTYREQLLAEQALLTVRLHGDRAALDQAHADGRYNPHGPTTVHAGDQVRVIADTWYPVLRVNPKTVTIRYHHGDEQRSWPWRIRYDQLTAVRCPHTDQPHGQLLPSDPRLPRNPPATP